MLDEITVDALMDQQHYEDEHMEAAQAMMEGPLQLGFMQLEKPKLGSYFFFLSQSPQEQC
jgi:hypothetical protein